MGAAILKGSGVKDSTIPVLVASTGIEVNNSADIRRPDLIWPCYLNATEQIG
ncbi:hypothetical protein ACFLVW_06260 [Chloroflexota bacterium]